MLPIVSVILLQKQSRGLGASLTLHSSGALSEHTHLVTKTHRNVWVPGMPHKVSGHLTEYNFTLLYHLPPLRATFCVILKEVTAESSSGSPLSSSTMLEATAEEEKFLFLLLCWVLPLGLCHLDDKRQISQSNLFNINFM